jgi:pilus assembly protein Flp/PilA
MERIKRFFKREEGVTAIEYALIAALIALAIILTVSLVGQQINSTFNTIAQCMGAS